MFSKLTSYFKRGMSEAKQWGRRGKIFWQWIVWTFVILFVFYWLRGELKDRIRWVGTTFELLGVVAVVVSINRARLSFGKPSVLSSAFTWLGDVRFIICPRRPVALHAVPISTGLGIESSVATVVVRAEKSIEARIDQLEKDLKEVETNLTKLDQKVDQQKQDLQATSDRKIAALQTGVQNVGKKLEEGMIGDSPLEVAGIAYVALGLIMAHLSEEVAYLLSWFGVT